MTASWKTVYGSSSICTLPLFGHQFSHCWVDYRGLRTPSCWLDPRPARLLREHAPRHHAQQAYARANPEGLGRLRRHRVWRDGQ